MGELHEEHLARINGGTKTRSSGNQWHDQGDGRDNHDQPFAFCWDGKSTRGKQIAVTLDIIAKIREQSQGERPQIGLRWYGNDALDIVLEDWIAILATDFEEMKLAAIRCALAETEAGDLRDQAAMVDSLQTALGKAEEDLIGVRCELGEVRTHRDALREELDAAGRALETAQGGTSREEAISRASEMESRYDRVTISLRDMEADRNRYRELATAAQKGRLIPPYVPRVPWTVVYQVRLDGRIESSGLHYAEDGQVTPFEVGTVRVERSIGSDNRPRLVVNEMRVPDGDLYTDGVLVARTCHDDPSVEAG
jgi:hypothetical protein